MYDNEDAVCGIVYNDVPYYFLKNLQNDIIAIADANGDTVARYTYDAWGVPTVAQDTTTAGIATINPYRYRGYYYDTEIELYYIFSRYYNPKVGRFLSSDTAEILETETTSKEYNLYNYCQNDPVNHADFGGYIIWSTIFKFIAGLLFGAFIQFFSDAVSFLLGRLLYGNKVQFKPYIGDYLGTMLEYGFDFILPIFGKKAKAILSVCSLLVPRLAKHGVNFWCHKKIKIEDLIFDILTGIVAVIIDVFLGAKARKQISKIKKLPGAKNKKNYRQTVSKIDIKYKKRGEKISLDLEIPMLFLGILISAIFAD